MCAIFLRGDLLTGCFERWRHLSFSAVISCSEVGFARVVSGQCTGIVFCEILIFNIMAARSLGVTVGADDTSREPVYFEERYGSGGPLICYGAESRRRDAAFRPISHLHLQRFTTISQLFKASL